MLYFISVVVERRRMPGTMSVETCQTDLGQVEKWTLWSQTTVWTWDRSLE
jgi:hypothetical protein